jgi:hypothetical protein
LKEYKELNKIQKNTWHIKINLIQYLNKNIKGAKTDVRRNKTAFINKR